MKISSISLLLFIAHFITQSVCFSEECAHLTSFRAPARVVGHTIICSKLYHGIWAMPLANPATIVTGSLPCRQVCENYDQCPLAFTCLDGTDGICVFNTQQLRNGLKGTNCAGNGFAINYICLPLKGHIKDHCFGNPGTFCYEDDFKSESPVTTWNKVNQKVGGILSKKSKDPVYHDRLEFDATKIPATNPAANALAMLVNDPNAPGWVNYRVFANYRILHPDFTVFRATVSQMVGIIFRQNGNSINGEHYMVGWRGASNAATTSQIALYHWKNKAYSRIKSGVTAPLPANKWFGMSVEMTSSEVILRTNKSPLGENTTDCSQTGKDDPVHCNEYQEVFRHRFAAGTFLTQGRVGLYFAGAKGWVDDLAVVHLPAIDGNCGNKRCEPEHGENCLNCSKDCHPPCGCGDGVCSGDSEALGCREDCFRCKVYYVNNKTREWFFREDNVAAYYSFDDAKDVGKDNSRNFMHLWSTLTGASIDTGCASGGQQFDNLPPRCIRTEAGSPLFLKKEQSAYGKLPVGSCDVTIAVWAKLVGLVPNEETSSLIRWGAPEPIRRGLRSNVRLESGKLIWSFGNLQHVVSVNWNKAGLRHIVLVYSSKDVQTTIYVDGNSMGSKVPCTQKKSPQMVTFGRLLVGDFNGVMDDLKILSVAWSPNQVQADYVGSAPYVKAPDSIGFIGDINLIPTPMPYVPTPKPPTFIETTSTTRGDETLGDLWPGNRPTPIRYPCRQLCEQFCAPRVFLKCLCAHEYALPDFAEHVVCDASRQKLLFVTTALLLFSLLF